MKKRDTFTDKFTIVSMDKKKQKEKDYFKKVERSVFLNSKEEIHNSHLETLKACLNLGQF
jgi:hypothetical protein